MKRIISVLSSLFILCTCLSSCSGTPLSPKSDEELIREKIETFTDAYNDGDWETVMECLDRDTRKTFEAMINLLGGICADLTGIDIDLRDLFTLGVNPYEDDFSTLDINEINVLQDGQAVGITTMSLRGKITPIYFVMTYENGGWFISDMTDKRPAALNS